MSEPKEAPKPNPFVYYPLKAVLFTFYKFFFRLKITGAGNVPPASDPRGVILAPNHESFLDPPLVGIADRREVTYLANDYLFKHGFVGAILRAIVSHPIKTKADDFKTIRELIRLLKEKRCVVMFPEGTRAMDGQLRPAQSGVGFLAIKSGAWVVPTFIEGTFEAFPKGAKGFKSYPVSVRFGKAFVPSEDAEIMGAPDPNAKAAERLMADIAKLKEETLKKV